MTDKTDKIHWADRHITKDTIYYAWDESGANILRACFSKEEAREVLIQHARKLEAYENGSDPSAR